MKERIEMGSYPAEDHHKFAYALVARDIRRVAALVHRAEIDDGQRAMIDSALEQLESRCWVMFLYDPFSKVLVQDQDVYSDGRRVTTPVDWGDGFTTLVHYPDPADETNGSEADQLSEERWPR
jgi:hypothetical protein